MPETRGGQAVQLFSEIVAKRAKRARAQKTKNRKIEKPQKTREGSFSLVYCHGVYEMRSIDAVTAENGWFSVADCLCMGQEVPTTRTRRLPRGLRPSLNRVRPLVCKIEL